MFETHWVPPPPHLGLIVEEAHVWRVALAGDTAQAERYWPTLSRDEQQRATQLHFVSDRQRFVIARGVLREILGRYLCLAPADIEFAYESRGKPRLPKCASLRFNLAHSHELALIVVAREREVGIDVEQICAAIEAQTLSAQFFAPTEVQALDALPVTERLPAFFRCWTRKEAYLKAIGAGLFKPLDQFAVSLAPGQAAALLEVKWSEAETQRWSLWHLDVGPHYAAALAVEGRLARLCCWQWTHATTD